MYICRLIINMYLDRFILVSFNRIFSISHNDYIVFLVIVWNLKIHKFFAIFSYFFFSKSSLRIAHFQLFMNFWIFNNIFITKYLKNQYFLNVLETDFWGFSLKFVWKTFNKFYILKYQKINIFHIFFLNVLER